MIDITGAIVDELPTLLSAERSIFIDPRPAWYNYHHHEHDPRKTYTAEAKGHVWRVYTCRRCGAQWSHCLW